ncbi:MAG: hypothetical protein OEW23_08470 [Candidatus Aminicenantes bacterium]|nr:hypothetical protein [Candidatus Aminicenantes bacterium]
MIDVEEHFYDDDPSCGHPDVRTRLKDVSYFFLGNGIIQAAIQVAPSGEGTPIGLLIMNPNHLAKKRESLSMDPESGLENTMIRISLEGSLHSPQASTLQARWSKDYKIPSVRVTWQSSGFEVDEFFYCPNLSQPVLVREVRVKNLQDESTSFEVETGLLKYIVKQKFSLNPCEEKSLFLRYSLDELKKKVFLEAHSSGKIEPQTIRYWGNMAQAYFGEPLLDHYFDASRFQLPAVISKSGRVDGSLWQYTREWVRDQAMMAMGLTLSGHFPTARVILQRLISEFITDEGDAIDSSEKRHPDEVELDQNGILLYGLKQYVLWTEDLKLINDNWNKIKVIAGFPLKHVFQHLPSGLLANTREYWERHRAHGIQKGLELAHQLFVSLGLSDAAQLARMIDREKEALHWEAEAERIKQAILTDRRYGLVEEGCFIKRRSVDGTVQDSIRALAAAQLPEEVPLSGPDDHHLNPDTSVVLPMALNFVPADSDLAKNTMDSIETLWNQAWEGGGYGRYHVSSEPDSPGPWSFPSLFVARAYSEMQNGEKVWRILEWLNSLPGALSGSWFEFYGERLAPPFPQVGIPPWTWAEMLILLVHHILGIHPQFDRLRIQPKLLPGVNRIQASFPLRNTRLNLEIERRAQREPFVISSNSTVLESSSTEAAIAYSKNKMQVKIFIV